MTGTEWEHWHRRTQTHITSHSQPDKTHALAHTLGVNAKASPLKGPLEAWIHLWAHSGRSFAAHTKNKRGSITRHKHTHTIHNRTDFFFEIFLSHAFAEVWHKKNSRMQVRTHRTHSPVSVIGSDVVKVIGGSISTCLQESCRQTHRGTTSAFLM